MLNQNVHFENALLILQLISYIVAILGIIAIIIQVSSFKKNQKKEEKVNDQLLIQNSINVLKVFAEEIIPKISEADKTLPKIKSEVEIEALKQINSKLPNDAQLKQLPKSDKLNKQILNVSKNRAGIGRVFNRLEQVTVYMNYGMIKEDLVYIPVHKVFLGFVNENKEYFAQLTSDDAPYMNVLKLYNDWQDKNKIELLEKKRKHLEVELAALKNN
ncbi:hypothetical protein [Lactiplantibacillus plantarum]|uniref:hypothetical protein n=1 Tax=Lactiplantibacillus plantarum TaxID=1590 RepID=UPI0009783AD9|nr:hypothetical protein [Lactiplantibacillus plantarum]MCK8472481.1 hypothetical protein [Lactiplantibacillus plantarum]QCS77666.1 hypothetical protein FEM46_10370 [Lactiplantibacillus plantarum subsp. plantarum]